MRSKANWTCGQVHKHCANLESTAFEPCHLAVPFDKEAFRNRS